MSCYFLLDVAGHFTYIYLMSITYIGKLHRKCEMCDNSTPHTYYDDQSLMKGMCPEYDWEEMYICEKCAQRETVKREWSKIRRNHVGLGNKKYI